MSKAAAAQKAVLTPKNFSSVAARQWLTFVPHIFLGIALHEGCFITDKYFFGGRMRS
ncbi:MAG: hypothetical protein R2874_11420 [Desulfobacterales bacterium]